MPGEALGPPEDLPPLVGHSQAGEEAQTVPGPFARLQRVYQEEKLQIPISGGGRRVVGARMLVLQIGSVFMFSFFPTHEGSFGHDGIQVRPGLLEVRKD